GGPPHAAAARERTRAAALKIFRFAIVYRLRSMGVLRRDDGGGMPQPPTDLRGCSAISLPAGTSIALPGETDRRRRVGRTKKAIRCRRRARGSPSPLSFHAGDGGPLPRGGCP